MLATPALTSMNGRFYTDASAPGLVAFPPGCVDNLARASIKYWNVAPVSPGANVTVAPVSTLVESYRRATCAKGDCKAMGDASLYDDVFGLFGFPAQDGVDYRSWDGIVMGTRFGVSVYALNQKVATVLTAASEVANAICDEFATSDNVHVQLAVQAALVEVLLSKATPEQRIAALSNPTDIAAVMELSLRNLVAPEAGLKSCKSVDAPDRTLLFPVLAKARGWRRNPGRGGLGRAAV